MAELQLSAAAHAMGSGGAAAEHARAGVDADIEYTCVRAGKRLQAAVDLQAHDGRGLLLQRASATEWPLHKAIL